MGALGLATPSKIDRESLRSSPCTPSMPRYTVHTHPAILSLVKKVGDIRVTTCIPPYTMGSPYLIIFVLIGISCRYRY